MANNLEFRFGLLLDNIGDLIHNGVNNEFSCISEQNLCYLGINLRNVRSETGIDIKRFEELEKLVENISLKK